MFQTGQEFIDFVNKNGGPEKLAMLIFNNSYIKVYSQGEFIDFDDDFDKATGIFKFVERDIKGLNFISYKFLDYLEGLTFAAPDVDRDKLNYRNFRP